MYSKEFSDFGDVTYTEKTRAVIKIQDGCDRFCSYCIIPYARGRVRSRKPESIISEITQIASKGIKEVVITGIHIASYGKDFVMSKDSKLSNYRLIDLLEEINKEIDGDAEADFRAIYFDLDTEILISRIVNRRSCPKCGEIYNLKFKPTKVEGICDKCGTELTQRKDDNEETAKARFDTYFKETAPLFDYYKNKNLLKTINAEGSIDEVWERLLKVIND